MLRHLKVFVPHRRCVQLIFKRSLELSSQETHKDNEKLWVKSNVDPVVEPVLGVTLPELIWSRLPIIDIGKIAFEGRKRSYTYAELYKYSRGFAAALKHAGFKRNDVLAILSNNIPEYPIVVLGALEAGLIITLVNNMAMPHEMERHLDNSESVCVVTIPPLLDTIKSIVPKLPKMRHVILIGDTQKNCHSFYEMIKTDSTGMEFLKGSQINKDSVLKITYSSGTSGVPKGVLLTHSNLKSVEILRSLDMEFSDRLEIAGARFRFWESNFLGNKPNPSIQKMGWVQYPLITNMIQLNNPAVRSWASAEERIPERFAAILPFFHTYSFLTIMVTGMYQGVHCYCIPKMEKVAFIQAIKTHKPTVLHLTTPLFAFISKSSDIGDEDLKSLKSITAGASPVTKKTLNDVLSKAKHYVFLQEGYGMTEMSPVALVLRPSSKNHKIGSVGQPIPGTFAKIVDIDSGTTMGPNERGELWIKGPQIMKGYKNGIAETKCIIDPDGWLHTGDMACYDEDRHFYIIDRIKDLIKCKGFQVSPTEVENLLKDHEYVADAAVIGIPDERNQEVPRAYIVKANPNLTTADIHKYINPRLASYKRLKGGIEFLEAIPKNRVGKVLKRTLRENYIQEHPIK